MARTSDAFQEITMTASACRSYRILGLFARAALLGVLLGPAPAALAQGATTFDIRVPRRSGGLLPLSQLKVTVTLSSNTAVAFEVEDHEGVVRRIPAAGTLSPGSAIPPAVDFPQPAGATGGDSVSVEPPPDLSGSNDPQERRYVFTFDLLSDFNLQDFSCSDTTTANPETWQVRVLAGSPSIVGVCPLSLYPCGIDVPPPGDNCFDAYCLAPATGAPVETLVATVPGFPDQAQACASARPAVDVVLSLDRSGSMGGLTQGGASRPKIEALHDAVENFVDQWETLRSSEGGGAPAGDQIALNFFDTNAAEMDSVGVAAWAAEPDGLGTFNAKKDVIRNDAGMTNHIGAVNPAGATSMGDGLIASSAALFQGANNNNGHRKVILLMSDGQENTDARVKVNDPVNPTIVQTYPTSDPSTVTPLPRQSDLQIYAVTVGTGTAVSADINEDIATATGGFYLNSEDDADLMSPFFLDLLQNFLRFNTYEPVRLARASTSPTQPFTATVPMTSTTRAMSVAVLWNKKLGVLRASAVPPGGGPPTSSVSGDGSIFLSPRITAPPQKGEWGLRVELADAPSTHPPVPFDLVVLQDDLLIKSGIRVVAADYKPGDPIRLEARVTASGRDLKGLDTAAGSRVVARLVRPGNTIGDLLSESTAPATPPVPADPGTAADSKLANTLAANGGALTRTEDTVTLRDDDSDGAVAGDGIYTGRFPAQLPGHYHFVFAVEGEAPRSGRFSRQRTQTIHVRAFPSAEQTPVQTTITPLGDGQSRLTATFTPRTRFGNRLGPGWANYFWFTSPGRPAVKPQDRLDGSYVATIDFTGAPPDVTLNFEDTITSIDDSVPPDKLPVPLGDGTVFVPDILQGGGVRRWSLSLHGGVNTPVGDFGDACDGGLSLGLDAEYRFGSRFAAELFYGRESFDCGGADSDLSHFSLNAKAYFGSGQWRPFVGAGVGAYDFSPGSTETGFNLFAGLQANPSARLAVEATLRQHRVSAAGDDAHFLTAHLGLRIRF
jgi:hypothetical protein